MWKIFLHMYMDEKFGRKLNINFLDENFDRLKCMDGTNPNIIMLNENCIYMDESYKKDEIFG